MVFDIHGIYRHGCINCGEEISDLRLGYMLPCEKCLPIHVEDLKNIVKTPSYTTTIELTEKLGRLKKLRKLKHILEEVQ